VIAVGFVLLVSTTFIGWLVDISDFDTPNWLGSLVGSAFLIGAASMFCGLTYWLWMVAP
jgi:hypothetical protein